MKKGIALIAMLLAAVLMLSGCNLIGYDAELDGAQVVAKVNGTDITKAEWLNYRDYMVAYEQQYMMQYYGMSMPIDDEYMAAYGESALEQLIESVVIEDKLEELGLEPLPEEDAAEVESYADSMVDMYKMLLRFQNHPELETVEEEAERLAAAAQENPDEVTEPVATVTDAELDEMLTAELAETGYTRDYFVQTKTYNMQHEKLMAHTSADVAVTDEQVKTEFDNLVAAQKTSFDETPTLYAAYEQNAMDLYYAPAGYRGVKNLLIGFSAEKQAEIDELKNALTTAQTLLENGNTQLEEMKAEDISVLDEEGKKLYDEQMATLETQVADAQATIDETQPKLDAATEAAYAEALPIVEEVMAKLEAGETFDALMETYGTDGGMTVEPNKSRGYLVCDGLTMFVQEFQDAAMALANVGDVSEPVKTEFGYHILQYATDIAAGEVEFTDELKTTLYDTLLTQAQEAAYEAAVTQWVSSAKVETFPKIMK